MRWWIGRPWVHIADRGSKPQYVDIQIENIPARGVIDSGSDITIVGGELFKYVATIARLRKSQFHKPDKIPKTYNGRTFTLDGVKDLDITFSGVTMKHPHMSKQLRQSRSSLVRANVGSYGLSITTQMLRTGGEPTTPAWTAWTSGWPRHGLGACFRKPGSPRTLKREAHTWTGRWRRPSLWGAGPGWWTASWTSTQGRQPWRTKLSKGEEQTSTRRPQI